MSLPPSVVPFLILSRGRTGSTYLHQLLDSHSSCICFEEIFADRNLPPLPEAYPADRVEPMQSSAALRVTEPVRFLHEFVYADYPPEIRAVGFKLFYFHARVGNGARLWEYLRGAAQIRIVHLGRRNILRMFTSMKIALKTGCWWSHDGSPGLAEKRVALDPAEFERYVREVEQARREGDRMFAHHPMLRIDYEDFESHTAGNPRIDDLLGFLGLPASPLCTPMQRQNPERLRDLIANYDELMAHFSDTPLITFFDEP